MKVGDLIRDKRWPNDPCGIITEVRDLRTKKPYTVWCPAWGESVRFEKKYIQEECEVISESR
tara:strand:+ start:385 stop:570 length:186 start_codon:yes stop_codon:yes gene_type:complete